MRIAARHISLMFSAVLLTFAAALEINRHLIHEEEEKCRSDFELALRVSQDSTQILQEIRSERAEISSRIIQVMILSDRTRLQDEIDRIDGLLINYESDEDRYAALLERAGSAMSYANGRIADLSVSCADLSQKIATRDLALSINYILVSIALFFAGTLFSAPISNIISASRKSDN